jgi:protein-S-isoprenylcysteine O-methyltransferase Ste14
MAANAYFAFSVRIQSERGQEVATGGPYRVVRHPGYVGAMSFALAAALMLGSAWALIPAGIAVVLLAVRTGLEDRVLHRELPGYPDYAARTRFRLIPGIW